MDAKIILGRLLQRSIDQGYAQVEAYNRFDFILLKKTAIVVLRENGNQTEVSFSKILDGIIAYQQQIELYELGPASLRDFGITHITSPVFALLHLLEKKCIYKIKCLYLILHILVLRILPMVMLEMQPLLLKS